MLISPRSNALTRPIFMFSTERHSSALELPTIREKPYVYKRNVKFSKNLKEEFVLQDAERSGRLGSWVRWHDAKLYEKFTAIINGELTQGRCSFGALNIQVTL